ncbi:MAG: hypothetical protein EOM06_15605 [Sphingobacteriia bacterium]|nr:hypothetical protein [Sphingobacteriia bacterium]
MTKKTKEQFKADLAKARKELDKLEAQIDEVEVTKGVEDCGCNNPGCSGVEIYTYVAAVGASIAGGISA